MPFEWQKAPTDEIVPALQTYHQAVLKAIGQAVNVRLPEMENWMKARAPWTDRTGNARQALWTDVIELPDRLIIYFGHGVSYGIYLELSNAGAYGIVAPAVDWWGPIIWNDIRFLLS